MKQNSFKVIGLTGGIATGKSTVSEYILNNGYPVIDADNIAREVVKKGKPALEDIRNYFGDKVINKDGALNRDKLRSIVFDDELKLKMLNKITHPRIIEEIKRKIFEYNKKGKKLIFLDAPLLIEANLQNLVDEIWLVSIEEEVQINRLVKRDQISRDEAKKIIDSQMPLSEKKKHADKIIDNSKDINHLYSQIEELISDEERSDIDV